MLIAVIRQYRIYFFAVDFKIKKKTITMKAVTLENYYKELTTNTFFYVEAIAEEFVLIYMVHTGKDKILIIFLVY